MKSIKWTPADSRDFARWLRAGNVSQSPAEYACALQHQAARQWRWADVAVVAIGIVSVVLIAAGVL